MTTIDYAPIFAIIDAHPLLRNGESCTDFETDSGKLVALRVYVVDGASAHLGAGLSALTVADRPGLMKRIHALPPRLWDVAFEEAEAYSLERPDVRSALASMTDDELRAECLRRAAAEGAALARSRVLLRELLDDDPRTVAACSEQGALVGLCLDAQDALRDRGLWDDVKWCPA